MVPSIRLNFKVFVQTGKKVHSVTEAEQKINSFLVDVFNDVLRLEEDDLARGPYKNLSVSEMHVLEAVDSAAGGETMRELAARLRVTASTLTVAVKTLEQKGYLVRARAEEDRRKVTVTLTDAARGALERHAAFHEQMVDGVSRRLTPAQMDQLADTLAALHGFFTDIQ